MADICLQIKCREQRDYPPCSVAAVKCRPVLHHRLVIFARNPRCQVMIMDCMLFKYAVSFFATQGKLSDVVSVTQDIFIFMQDIT